MAMSIDDLAFRLQAENISQLSGKLGIHWNTLYKLKEGKSRGLHSRNYIALVQYFDEKDKEGATDAATGN